MLYNTQLVISPVPLPESKFKEIKTDPVAIQSIWRGGNYLNLILQVKVKDQKHGYHFIENKLENKDGEQTLYLTLYHTGIMTSKVSTVKSICLFPYGIRRQAA